MDLALAARTVFCRRGNDRVSTISCRFSAYRSRRPTRRAGLEGPAGVIEITPRFHSPWAALLSMFACLLDLVSGVVPANASHIPAVGVSRHTSRLTKVLLPIFTAAAPPPPQTDLRNMSELVQDVFSACVCFTI